MRASTRTLITPHHSPGVCARYFDGTDASRVKGASEAFVRLARGDFVAGCMSGGAELAAVGG